MTEFRGFPDPLYERDLLRLCIAALLCAVLIFLLSNCSVRQQQAPLISPPAIVEVTKIVPAPCPVPPEVPEPSLLLPLLDPDTASVQSILQVLRADYAQLMLALEQARELLRVYVQQAEVVNAAPVTP